MTCAACSARVEKSVSALCGVNACSVNLLKNTMSVDYDESALSSDDIVDAVAKAVLRAVDVVTEVVRD